jgi:hypothetical protein
VEGIVSKRVDAPYSPGNRGLWLKVKCLNREEFVVVGWTDPEGARPWLGALLLAYYDPDGRLVYAGRAGRTTPCQKQTALRPADGPARRRRGSTRTRLMPILEQRDADQGCRLERSNILSALPAPAGACISENTRASGNSYLHGQVRGKKARRLFRVVAAPIVEFGRARVTVPSGFVHVFELARIAS